MKSTPLLLVSILCLPVPLKTQRNEAVVKMETVSIHTVERGSMAIFSPASGTLTSLKPPRAVLSFDGILENKDPKCESGRAARLALEDNPRPTDGKVVGITGTGACEVEFAAALPNGAVIGGKVGGLIVTDEIKDVVFFGRPANSRPNSTDIIFVVEGTSQARRVTVRYGAMSGPLIQVLEGLVPGDKVIVTDMSKWAGYPSVRLE